MASSGSYDFTETRNSVIARAFRIMGVIKSGETLGSQDVTDAAEALNAMVKRWSTTPGMHVWATQEATLFPQAGQVAYALSTNGADHCTSSYDATTLAAVAASGATSLSVASISGIASGDYVGVVLSSGVLHWTTVNGAPSGTTVVLTTGLSGTAASGAAVFAYTSKIVRPLRIPQIPGAVRRYSIASAIETPIGPPIARGDYQMLPNKAQTGIINQAFYGPQLNTGYLYLWNPPTTVTDLVKFTFHRPIQDFDAASDNPDLPQEWFDPLTWGLADVLAPEYDVPGERADRIGMKAAQFLDAVAGFDREAESIQMQPDGGP